MFPWNRRRLQLILRALVMKKFSINDWLTIQTRKDITFIRRSIEHESVDYAIFADMLIAILSFVLDHIFWTVVDPNTGAVEQVSPSYYWIIVGVLLVLAPAIVFWIGHRKKTKYQDDLRKVKSVEILIDLFDNEICYNVMNADSMRDQMKDQGNGIEDEIREFYYIEAMYYTNKAVSQLFYFKNIGDKGIQTPKSLGGISFTRFCNVCKIISNIYKDLYNYTNLITEYKPLFKDCKEHIKNFNDLLFYMSAEIPELSTLDQLMLSNNN